MGITQGIQARGQKRSTSRITAGEGAARRAGRQGSGARGEGRGDRQHRHMEQARAAGYVCACKPVLAAASAGVALQGPDLICCPPVCSNSLAPPPQRPWATRPQLTCDQAARAEAVALAAARLRLLHLVANHHHTGRWGDLHALGANASIEVRLLSGGGSGGQQWRRQLCLTRGGRICMPATGWGTRAGTPAAEQEWSAACLEGRSSGLLPAATGTALQEVRAHGGGPPICLFK